MNIMKSLLPLLLATGFSLAHADDNKGDWRPYVCKTLDWPACIKGKKRIYPTSDRYADMEACLMDFERKFEEDPAIREKYSQGQDIQNSYAFYCEDVNNPVDKAMLEKMEKQAATLSEMTKSEAGGEMEDKTETSQGGM